jgi:hypothetical protein
VRTTSGGKQWIRGRAWLDAYVARELHKQVPDADPLLSGGTSPALERYRNARASKEELSLAIQRGELAHVADVKQHIGGAIAIVRSALWKLQRDFGVQAYELMKEALDEAAEKIESYGSSENDSGRDRAGGQTNAK